MGIKLTILSPPIGFCSQLVVDGNDTRPFNLYKLRVVERIWGRVLSRRAWDDIVLSGREVECEFVDYKPMDQYFQPIETFKNEKAPTSLEEEKSV